MNVVRIAAGLLALTIVVGSCAGGGDVSIDPASTTTLPAGAIASSAAAAPGSEPSAPPSRPSPSEAPATIELSPLAELVQPAGNLRFDPATGNAAAKPVRVDIEGIGVEGATVSDVGVESNGELEVPGANAIGWYRWSAIPGQAGSAVLAAHIAYNGTNGVFRNLADVDVGAIVTIGFDDGSVREFEIIELSQYGKDELPLDRVFAKDGDPVLALITCGGRFNRTLRSYDDNVVAYAVPT